jgi:MraZ protein
MSDQAQRVAFVGKFTHVVDDKKRVSIPAKWRAAASGVKEFYVLPDAKGFLVVLPQEVMDKYLAKADDITWGDYDRRDAVRRWAEDGHMTPCDAQGRISLTSELLEHAGITNEALLVAALNKFEVWSPTRYAAHKASMATDQVAAAGKVGF